jgi:hypothetical protein
MPGFVHGHTGAWEHVWVCLIGRFVMLRNSFCLKTSDAQMFAWPNIPVLMTAMGAA